MSRRVLLIAYQFPPVGGAGVQRAVKFAKYLPAAGWSTSVLTVANPSVPVVDGSLGADVPASTVVRRARTWEPGYALKSAVSAAPGGSGLGPSALLRAAKAVARRAAAMLLQPDAQVLWAPDAVRQGERLLREIPHDAIVVTGPPFSSFLVGARLSRRTGLPLVLDYRDEWGISNAYWENRRPGPVSRHLQGRMQRAAVRRAKALIATTRASARSLETVRDEAGSTARVGCIYNGYDPDDFRGPPPPRPAGDGRYRLAYVGTLWNLTSVAPLVDAVIDLARRAPDVAARLELVFAGRRLGAQQEHLGRLGGLPCRVVEHPYLDHGEAIGLVRSADALCALLTDIPGAGRVVPAKIFEYMAAKRPILAIAPRGELWDLLADVPAAFPIEPGRVGEISARLETEIRTHSVGAARGDPDWPDCPHDRPSQAAQLAETLTQLVRGESAAVSAGGT